MPPTFRRAPPVYLLGSYQSDFARDVTAEGKGLVDLLGEAVTGAIQAARLEPREIEVAHIGNWAGELLCGQGHLGAVLGEAVPALAGLPAGRHEAAGASGALAVLGAMADLESGRYDVALVIGADILRGESEFLVEGRLAVGLRPDEAHGVPRPYAGLYGELAAAYEARYGLRPEHLRALGDQALRYALRNPRAMRRSQRPRDSLRPGPGMQAEGDELLARGMRRRDVSPLADGAAAVVLASERFASTYARRRVLSLPRLPRLTGWGHRTAPLALRERLRQSVEHLLPELRVAISDALSRAALSGPEQLSALECQDAYTISEYAIIDHLGLAPLGQPWRLIEDGTVLSGGKLPVNPSGGLLGCGHAGGATGVRMVADAARQVSDGAGENQVPGATHVGVVCVGGALATVVTLVVEATRGRITGR